jgi:hypothetical protein
MPYGGNRILFSETHLYYSQMFCGVPFLMMMMMIVELSVSPSYTSFLGVTPRINDILLFKKNVKYNYNCIKIVTQAE